MDVKKVIKTVPNLPRFARLPSARLHVKRRSVPIGDKMLPNVLARQAVAPTPGNHRVLQQKIAAVPEKNISEKKTL